MGIKWEELLKGFVSYWLSNIGYLIGSGSGNRISFRFNIYIGEKHDG